MGTNLQGLAGFDASWMRPGVGKLFIVPYPVTAGEVGKVTVTAGGTGFTQGAQCTFGAPPAGGRIAKGFVNVGAGIITSVQITDPGAGYVTPPTCTAPTGTGATLTPALGNGAGPLIWTAPPAVPVFADYLAGFLQRIYQDPTQCKTLLPGLTWWASLTADGFKPKFKQDTVDVDPNDGPKFNLAAMDLLVSGEFSFYDLNIDHLQDALSSTAGQRVDIAAATGKAGRSRLGMGSERVLSKYVLIYRMPSPKYTGEFDHLIIPRATISVDTELALAKSKESIVKIGFSSQAEPCLISPDNGELCTCAFDFAVAAGL